MSAREPPQKRLCGGFLLGLLKNRPGAKLSDVRRDLLETIPEETASPPAVDERLFVDLEHARAKAELRFYKLDQNKKRIPIPDSSQPTNPEDPAPQQ